MDLRRALKMLLTLPIAMILCVAAEDSSFKLTVLHTNDVHSRFDEAHKYGGLCSAADAANGDCVGGVSRRMTKVREFRETTENLLLLDGGDQFQGTFWFFVFQGQASAFFTKHIGYDAMAIGNHEFDAGMENLQDFVTDVSSTFDVLSANIDNSNEPGLTGYKKYVIKEVNGRKIAIIGYTTSDTPILTSAEATGNLEFHDVVQSVRECVEEIKTSDPSVNIFIAVGHAGFDMDQMVAKEVDDIDIVVGGHSNTFLYTGTPPSSEEPEGPYPYPIAKNDGKTAYCVQAAYFSKYLGHLVVEFDNDGEILAAEGNPILLDDSVPKDPETEKLLIPFREAVEEAGSFPVGQTTVTIEYEDCRNAECNMGNLAADSWIHSNIQFGTGGEWARASIALANGGSFRAPLERGNITSAALLTAMPFSNSVVAIKVTGETLLATFEHSISSYMNASSNGRFLQVSGIQVLYDVTKPMGERVVDLKALCLACEIPEYETVKKDAVYSLLTSSFMAGGGDGYSMLRDDALYSENLGLIDSDMVIEYIYTLNKVYPALEGRIKFTTDVEHRIANANHRMRSRQP